MSRVYFAASDGRIKVGVARDVKRRLQSISACLPHELVLIGDIEGSYKVERAVQKHLAKYRIKGEWFQDCDETRRMVRNFILADQKRASEDRPKPKPKRYEPRQMSDEEWLAMWAKVVCLVWPVRTALELSKFSGFSEEECHAWLSGAAIPPLVVRATFAIHLASWMFEDQEPRKAA